MSTLESDLNLMQKVLDGRFAGDVEQFEVNLERLESVKTRELEQVWPMFREVGNRCLVFFSNEEAMDMCEKNPDDFQGVIVDDYDCIIKNGSRAVGSVMIGRGKPAVLYSGANVSCSTIAGKIIRSEVASSYVSVARDGVIDSKLTRSFASSAGGFYRADLEDCFSFRGLRCVSASGRKFSVNDEEYMGTPDDGIASRMLLHEGIRVEPS